MGEPTTPPSTLGLGPAWTRIGYGVLALAVVALLGLVFVRPAFALPAGGSVPPGYRLIAGNDVAKEGGMVVRASVLGVVALFAWIFSALATFVWTLVDVIDRKKRFVWLIPLSVCPFTGLHFIPLALYLFFGRETVGHGEGVR